MDLSNTTEYNQYWVVVDRFAKIAYFLIFKNEKAKELAGIFVREICQLHRLPKSIVSDRDTVFMSSF